MQLDLTTLSPTELKAFAYDCICQTAVAGCAATTSNKNCSAVNGKNDVRLKTLVAEVGDNPAAITARSETILVNAAAWETLYGSASKERSRCDVALEAVVLDESTPQALSGRACRHRQHPIHYLMN